MPRFVYPLQVLRDGLQECRRLLIRARGRRETAVALVDFLWCLIQHRRYETARSRRSQVSRWLEGLALDFEFPVSGVRGILNRLIRRINRTLRLVRLRSVGRITRRRLSLTPAEASEILQRVREADSTPNSPDEFFESNSNSESSNQNTESSNDSNVA